MDRELIDAVAHDPLEAAASWDTRLRSTRCTADDRAAFARWIEADFAHEEAFERLQMISIVLRGETKHPQLRSVRDSALAVVSRRRQRLKWTLVAGVAGVVMAAALWMVASGLEGLWGNSGTIYVTGIGQRSKIDLQDGSSMELNSQTKVHVVFDGERRLLTLLDGQALFRVARDPHRPFMVHARDRQIMALGTAFDVRLEPAVLKVTLLEGKVSVAHDSERVILAPGEQLVAVHVVNRGAQQTRSADVVRPIEIDKVTGWREGSVFMEGMSLRDAVAEMNKHSAVQIVIRDEAIETLRISGMFKAGKQRIFAAALENYFPIEVEASGATEIELHLRQ